MCRKNKLPDKDADGVIYKYPNRTCKDCAKYPCFKGINNLKSDFAKYGCKLYQDADN